MSYRNRLRTALVMGAGLGKRLRPLTDEIAKPMLEVKGRPLIASIFDNLIGVGIERFIVNTHHCAETYTNYFRDSSYRGVEIIFSHEDELLDTGGTIKDVIKYMGGEEDLLIHNGDIYYEGDLLDFIEKAGEVDSSASLLLRSEGVLRNVRVDSGYVVDIRDTLGIRGGEMKQFTGIFIGRKKFLEFARDYDGKKFSSIDLFIASLRRGEKILGIEDSGDSVWSDIGTIEEYERMR